MSVIFFIGIIAGLVTRNFHLRNLVFPDWDAGIYAQVAVEILQNSSLITTFNGDLWLNKPPLVHALVAVIFSIFGRSEFWARMLMVAFAVAMLYLTYRLGKTITERLFARELGKLDRRTRQALFLMPPAALAASPLFIERSTLLNTDIVLGVAWLGYFLRRNRYFARMFYLTLGVMSKSFLGFYPLLFEVFLIRKKDITLRNIVKTIPLIIIPASWHIYSYIAFGDFFIKAHVADQVVKRVVAPIELHFGGTYYYPQLLWANLGGVGFFLFVSYILIAAALLFTVGPKKLFALDKQTLWRYIVLLSPWPFFILLVFMKSKIPWYLASVLPLFCIALPAFFLVLRDTFIRRMAILFVFVLLISSFVPQTFLLKPTLDVPEKIKMAQCIASIPQTTVAFAVDQRERDIRNVLEAAQLQTETSFMYGGSPSFIYYAQAKVKYYYNPTTFLKEYRNYELAAVSNGDGAIHEAIQKAHRKNPLKKSQCSNREWTVYLVK